MTPQQQQPEDTRNTTIFFVCAMALMAAYWFFIEQPQEKHARELAAKQAAAHQQLATTPQPSVFLTREQALAAGPRVQVRTPTLSGSINLNGAVIDDLSLLKYAQKAGGNSPPVVLFEPKGTEHAHYAGVEWSAPGAPDYQANWRLVSGSVLSPGRPVDLEFDSVNGLTWRRHISVDDNYMFTVADTLVNTSNQPITVAQGASAIRKGEPADLNNSRSFVGAIGVFPSDGNKPDKKKSYRGWKKEADKAVQSQKPLPGIHEKATGGWYGLTDQYWLAAVVPADQKAPVDVSFHYDPGSDTFAAAYLGPTQTLAPGGHVQKTVDIFAGPKTDDLLQKTYAWVPNFHLAIDWGWAWFVSQPIFWLLQHIRALVIAVLGPIPTALGLSILLLTVVIRGAMFPLALQGYASMTKMKKIQPLMEEVRKRYADDQMKQQQEMMALYQREKINPLAGCLPMLATIPVFIALANVLFVSIELRHAPFFGWIHDLSARDPTTIMTLFGLIHWDPAKVPVIGAALDSWLHIGVWPLLYGLTTAVQMQMSPTSTDPTQQTMMKFMPLLFMAFLANYPAGLLIYYVWSNMITIGQQWFMMRRHGVDNPIDAFIARFVKSKKQG